MRRPPQQALADALAGWGDRDIATLARLTGGLSDRVQRLMDPPDDEPLTTDQ